MVGFSLSSYQKTQAAWPPLLKSSLIKGSTINSFRLQLCIIIALLEALLALLEGFCAGGDDGVTLSTANCLHLCSNV